MDRSVIYICSVAPLVFGENPPITNLLSDIRERVQSNVNVLAFTSRDGRAQLDSFIEKSGFSFENIPSGKRLVINGIECEIAFLENPWRTVHNAANQIAKLLVKRFSPRNETAFMAWDEDCIAKLALTRTFYHKALCIQTRRDDSLAAANNHIQTFVVAPPDSPHYTDQLDALATKLKILMDARHKTPRLPKKLPGEIWGITTFFNPGRFKNKAQNFRLFRTGLQKQGLKLLAIELTFDQKQFELREGDADRLIQLKGSESNLMWQKERLLNIALKELPAACDKVVWLDCDILFENQSWVRQTARKLEIYPVVQPFEWVVRLPKGQVKAPLYPPLGDQEGGRFYSTASSVAKFGPCVLLRSHEEAGHSGFAWSARREFLERVTFFDQAILGSADNIMSFGFFGVERRSYFQRFRGRLTESVHTWRSRILPEEVKSVGYTPGTILHLWHGSLKHRRYVLREETLSFLKFDLHRDIELDEQGLWRWTPNAQPIHNFARRYFQERFETGTLKQRILFHLRYPISSIVGYANTESMTDRCFYAMGKFIQTVSPTLFRRIKWNMFDKHAQRTS